MQILEFSKSRDLELYITGDIEAFKNSYPGISITNELRSDIRQNFSTFEITDFSSAYTAVINDIPVGFIMVQLSGFYTIPQGYISSIFVEKKYRREGVSTKLIEIAEKWAKSKGAFSITLDVSLVNESAISTYEASGFRETRVQMEKII